MRIYLKHLLIILFIFVSLQSFSQFTQEEKKKLKEANEYFQYEEFDKALPLFLSIDSVINDYIIKYRIGACYLNTKYEKLKALPYLEEASKNKTIEIPLIVHYDLGTLYHYTYRFEEAIEQFNKYIVESKKHKPVDKKILADAKRMITICKNAMEITTKTFKAEINILEHPINTMESEYCPMASADDQILVYMRTVGLGKTDFPATSIMISHKGADNNWEKPMELLIENHNKYKNKEISLAGLSPDGQTIFLDIGYEDDKDIYEGKIDENTVINIKKLNKKINSNYNEGRVSITPDGSTLYFVSDRPEGYGGTDIYKSKRNKKGDWDTPVNLGNIINTKYNENSPFIHPDNVTLFFSSEGHKTIGGNDIFKSTFKNNVWSEPENLGFPNSTKDDLFFVLCANGQTGYFSTSKNNIYNKYNIFKVNFEDPIPLTLVKGIIKAGNPPKPVDVDIKVYDKETGLCVKYVYNPLPKTGKYLMIFPPAKNYNIIISSKDYLPQLVNVYIPYQTYFYELYQEIWLEPISINNKTVGEKVTVNNMFYDMYKTAEADSILLDDLPKQPKYYDHLLELVENIIQTTDTMHINYIETEKVSETEKESIESLLNLIEDAIETTDAVTLNILDANARQKDKIKETHFYSEGDKDKSLQMTVIGVDTFYTAPPITSKTSNSFTHEPIYSSTKYNTKISFRTSSVSQRNYIHYYKIYYDVNKDKIPKYAYKELEDICKILINNPNLGAEIYGFTDLQGEKQFNLSLSRKRAQNVLKYFIDNNVDRQKLIAKGFGEAATGNSNSRYNRKVEINIFEIKK
jgi:outer membrane protein OmpA-like peptidoglycan-associated protein/tetratricopeptide (TPR) repeat protein